MDKLISPEILTIVAGVSSIFGLMGLMSYLMYRMYRAQVKKTERSIREMVVGEDPISASQVIEILKQFQDDESRLQALETLTQHDIEKANQILVKLKENIDPERMDAIAKGKYLEKFRTVAAVFIIFAVVGTYVF